MNHALPEVLAFVDTETTGMNPRRHRVIELGILRVENGREVARIDTLINPHTPIPQEITSLTGITREELLRAPDWVDMQSEVRDILDGAVFVAHNARFDYAFLKHEFGRHESDLRAKVMCTVRLTRALFPGLPHYNLGAIIEHFGFQVDARHRAFADANVLWELYQNVLSTHGEESVAEAIHAILKTGSHPPNLSKELVDKLPDGPGVYSFFGDNMGLPLYIGKSVNIRERVKSHFSGDHSSPTDLTISPQVKKIEALETAGEIGALIREADMVKSQMPVYNRQLRRRQDMIVAAREEKNGFSTIEIKKFQDIKPDTLNTIMAVYKSKKQATEHLHELCREHALCPKLIGIENGPGPCFMSQLGVCRGACAGQEEAFFHNTRVLTAFAQTRIKAWPFSGSVVFTELGENGLAEMHVINNWCYLGSIVYNSDLDEPKVVKSTPRFDFDIYKILAKVVLKSKKVHPMTDAEKTLWEGSELFS